MKNLKNCSKCSSSEVVRIKGNAGPGGAGNNIPMNPGFVLVTRYVCLKCGFIEEWVDDLEDLQKIEKKIK
jgi:predicted nucleic-acid-binding Zn-ribbon protein